METGLKQRGLWDAARGGLAIESRWAGTEVGQSDDVGRSDKSLAPPLIIYLRYRGGPAGPKWAGRESRADL